MGENLISRPDLGNRFREFARPAYFIPAWQEFLGLNADRYRTVGGMIYAVRDLIRASRACSRNKGAI